MRMLASVLPFVVCASLVACVDSEEQPETLTCEVLASPDFCWTVGVGEAYTCVDPSLDAGVFNTARTECTYSDGTRIEFDQAVPEDVSSEDAYLWNFSIIDPGGTECLRFEETDHSSTVVSASGIVDQQRAGVAGIDLECPDGEVLHTSNGLNLLGCEEEDAVLPGYSYIRTTGSISWALLGAPDGTSGLWTCQSP